MTIDQQPNEQGVQFAHCKHEHQSNVIEIEPGLIYRCCGFCAAYIREQALLHLVSQGCEVTFKNVQKPNQPES